MKSLLPLFIIVPVGVGAGLVGMSPVAAAVLCAFWQAFVAYTLTQDKNVLRVAAALAVVSIPYFIMFPLVTSSEITEPSKFENAFIYVSELQTWLTGGIAVLGIMASSFLGFVGVLGFRKEKGKV